MRSTKVRMEVQGKEVLCSASDIKIEGVTLTHFLTSHKNLQAEVKQMKLQAQKDKEEMMELWNQLR